MLKIRKYYRIEIVLMYNIIGGVEDTIYNVHCTLYMDRKY